MLAHFPGNVRKHNMAVCQFHVEFAIAEGFYDRAFHFNDAVFFRHTLIISLQLAVFFTGFPAGSDCGHTCAYNQTRITTLVNFPLKTKVYAAVSSLTFQMLLLTALENLRKWGGFNAKCCQTGFSPVGRGKHPDTAGGDGYAVFPLGG